MEEKQDAQRLFVVLERAMLESVNAGRHYELLNCDDHLKILQKHKRDLSDARPDITHQCLLSLLDSPLNKAGKLQVYVHTERNVLIEISPHLRIPRTFKRFAGLVVQLLKEMRIRAANANETLMRVVKNPVTQYFPVGARVIGTSHKAERLVRVREYAHELVASSSSSSGAGESARPVVFVIGALARGAVEVDYTDELVSFSKYPLSAALACTKLCDAFEEAWGVH